MVTASAALADGGTTQSYGYSQTWGHVTYTAAGDCHYLNLWIKSFGPGYGGRLQAETYGSIDGFHAAYQGLTSDPQQPDPKFGGTPCDNNGRSVAPSQLYVSEHVAHWVSWYNNGQGAWFWCNNGPWVGNAPGTSGHYVLTGYTWWSAPCLDQDYSRYYYLYSMIQGQTVNGWQNPVGTNTNWIYDSP